MTDRAIKEERSLSGGQRTSFSSVCTARAYVSTYVRTCVSTLAMLPTQPRSTYVRYVRNVSKYRRYQPTIQPTLLSLLRRPRSTGCILVLYANASTFHCPHHSRGVTTVTGHKNRRLFTSHGVHTRCEIKWN